MKPTIPLALAVLVGASQFAAANSIVGNPAAPDITSINSGQVTAYGNFGGGSTTISGGHDNSISVSGLGASITEQITKVGSASYSTSKSISAGKVYASNSGDVSSTGIFNDSDISSSGGGNSMSVLAAGTYVNMTITHR